MKTVLMTAAVLFIIGIIAEPGGRAAAAQSGEELFKQNCAPCHANGGNIINPQKTLHKKDRDANNVKTANDIVKIMRNPGPGMTKFDQKTLPDKDARTIADYIMGTFK